MQKWRVKEDTQGENEKEKEVEVLGERVKGVWSSSMGWKKTHIVHL